MLSKNAVHPYTKALMDSIFDINMDFSKLIKGIEGGSSKSVGSSGRLSISGQMRKMYGNL